MNTWHFRKGNRAARVAITALLTVALLFTAAFVLPVTGAAARYAESGPAPDASVSLAQAAKYQVSFNAQGGSSVKAKSVASGGKIGALKTPKNKNFKFKGWYTKSTGGKKITKNTKVAKALTAYAHWQVKKGYAQATFKAYGYNIYKAYKKSKNGVKLGAAASKTVTRKDYVFRGWYTKAAGGTTITKDTKIKKNTTYYAQWEVKNSANSASEGNGSTIPTPVPTPTPTPAPDDGSGSGGAGGGSGADGTDPGSGSGGSGDSGDGSGSGGTGGGSGSGGSDPGSGGSGGVTTVTVSFNSNGGSVSPASKTVTVGQTYGTLPTPTRSNYMFMGWFTASTGGTQVSETITVSNTANHTLYARWANTVTITLDANGGSSSVTSKIVTLGMVYGWITAPRRANHEFMGWYTALTGGTQVNSATLVTNASDHTLYARWQEFPANTVEVTLHANGGIVAGGSSTNKAVVFGEPYGTLPTPTKFAEGFDWVFAGWYTMQTGGEQITVASVVESGSPHTLYAQWNPPSGAGYPMVLTYNANGGTVSPASREVYYDSIYGNLVTPTRTNYVFDGWYTAATGGTVVDYNTRVTTWQDHTIYAHWTTNVVVSFNANGGSGGPSSKTCRVGHKYGEMLPYPTHSDAHKEFQGWYTAATGGTMVFSTTTVTSTSNHTLYAHWSTIDISVNVTLNPTGGVVEPNSVKVEKGAAYGALPIPTKEGSDFAGWFTQASGGTQVVPSTAVSQTAQAHTLYARWQGIGVNVIFRDASGRYFDTSIPHTAPDYVDYGTKTVRVGESYGTIPVPLVGNKTQHLFDRDELSLRYPVVFDGWYSSLSHMGEAAYRVTEQTIVTNASDHKLYARWVFDDQAIADFGAGLLDDHYWDDSIVGAGSWYNDHFDFSSDGTFYNSQQSHVDGGTTIEEYWVGNWYYEFESLLTVTDGWRPYKTSRVVFYNITHYWKDLNGHWQNMGSVPNQWQELTWRVLQFSPGNLAAYHIHLNGTKYLPSSKG